jgi:cysteine-rich repeat protein
VTNAGGWTAAGSLIQLAVIGDGYPTPDALEVSFQSGPVRAESGAAQCVPASGGQHYDLQAAYRIPTDTPTGVGAIVIALLYAGTGCAGQFVGSPLSGPEGLVRGAWTPYSLELDTTALATGAAGSLLLRLDVVRPANVDGSRVDWDSVSLNAPGPRCGDCNVDPGETCDDGNRTSGDGCSASCQLESCGDGVKEGAEQCDDGNTTFGAGDTCTPDCRQASACDTCAGAQCPSELSGCFGLAGVAQGGPKAGTARSTLCDALLTCVRRTDCDLAPRTVFGNSRASLENCYCGTSADHCFDGTVKPNGSCRAETEAAVESTSPAQVVGRLDGSNTNYPVFAAVGDLLACEGSGCTTQCARSSVCGDGVIEDRDLTFTFVVNGQDVPCEDSLTATGHGCSVEECDDGNTTPGDGCDQNCFLERCGNDVVQAGEECDDGNRVSGDGCSADCKLESHCGDGNVERPFEQCDPPSADGEGEDCTADEAQNSPTDCACDAKCQLAVCGNGVTQHPYEDCDPPDGVNCDADCKLIGQTPCEACIATDPIGSVIQAAYCDPDLACVTTERCAINAKCFSPLAAVCYCGPTDSTGATDVAVCSNASFTPTGPCVDEIKAGSPTGSTNDDILTAYFDFGTSSGAAMGTLNSVFANAPECASVCF